MFRWCAVAASGLLSLAAGVGCFAQEIAPDYSKLDAWLCHPKNSSDTCDRDLDATIVAPNGKLTKQPFKEAKDQPIDCFYIYPTTSLDNSVVSDLNPGKDEELITAYVQAARFRSQCRVFAPIYRQFTIASLRPQAAGSAPLVGDRASSYKDVVDAWNYYLQNENQGRGVVVIGHSQGNMMATRLLAAEVDGKPIQKQLVSAFLIGFTVEVPKGQVMGGTFKNIPLCTKADQSGCVVTFSSYRSTLPPPATALFGRARGAEMEAGCTNPAALTNGKSGKVELDSYLSTVGEISLAHKAYVPWTNTGEQVKTPFVSVPGLLSAECVQRGQYSYLEITVNADPKDARTDEIVGDLVGNGGVVNQGWGLHLIDMTMTMGNLVDLVGRQAKAYSGK